MAADYREDEYDDFVQEDESYKHLSSSYHDDDSIHYATLENDEFNETPYVLSKDAFLAESFDIESECNTQRRSLEKSDNSSAVSRSLTRAVDLLTGMPRKKKTMQIGEADPARHAVYEDPSIRRGNCDDSSDNSHHTIVINELVQISEALNSRSTDLNRQVNVDNDEEFFLSV
jgi:hypothetical protein